MMKQGKIELPPSEITIGPYTLSYSARGWLRIDKDDGEGGEFNKDDFLKVLDKFYSENF